MLDQRRRRWCNINTTLGQRLISAGISDNRVKCNLATEHESKTREDLNKCHAFTKLMSRTAAVKP